MFKKKLLFILLAVFVVATTLLNAQNKKTSTSKKSELVKLTFGDESVAGNIEHIFKDAKGCVYIIKKKEGNMFKDDKFLLIKYDAALKQVFEKELIVPTPDNREMELMEVMVINHQPTLFCQGMSKKANGQIFAMAIKEDGTLDKPEQISHFTAHETFINCKMVLSQDSSKFMLFAELQHTDERLPMLFKVFDNQLKEIWTEKKHLETNEGSNKLNYFAPVRTVYNKRKLLLDNSGRVWVLVPVARVSKKAGKEESEQFFHIHQFTQGDSTSKLYTIDFGKKVIYDIGLAQSKNPHELICFGTYTGTTKLSAIKGDGGVMGTFQCRLDVLKGAIAQQSIEAFTEDIFEFMDIKERKKAVGDGIKNVRIWRHYVTDSNNLLLILEKNYSTTYTSSTTPAPITTDHSDMTFVVKYTPDGKIVYQHYVPKIGAGYFGTHATCLQHQEEEIIIFNTNPENLKQEPQHFSDLLPIEHHIFGQTIACAASFDPQGEQTKTVLLSSKETPFIIQPEALAFQYAPRSVIVMAKSKKNTDKFKLIRLDY